MKLVLIGIIVLILSACSAPHDKYIGYWKLEESKYPAILEISKEGKDTYLVNHNLLQETDLLGQKPKAFVLEKKGDELAVNNDLMLIPFNLSSDGKTLRIEDKKYIKMNEKDAKAIVKNKTDCTELEAKFKAEKQPFDGFFYGPRKNPNQDKLDEVKGKYTELKSKIPECGFEI